jgi:uracil-DNA glycosylase
MHDTSILEKQNFNHIDQKDRREQLQEIIDDIYTLNVCGEDTLKVKRDIDCLNINSDVMLITEALAPSTGRISGVPYFHSNGRLGNTGRSLEKFLNGFGHTLYPYRANTVYSTEVVNSFPGYKEDKGGRSIRRPTNDEVVLSVRSGVLDREIDLVSPRIIFLMGNTAYKSFYKYFLKEEASNTLTSEIDKISISREFHAYYNIPVIPLQHSSGANPRFNSLFNNNELLGLINEILMR